MYLYYNAFYDKYLCFIFEIHLLLLGVHTEYLGNFYCLFYSHFFFVIENDIAMIVLKETILAMPRLYSPNFVVFF